MAKKTKEDDLVFCAPGVTWEIGAGTFTFGDPVPATGLGTKETKRSPKESHADALQRLLRNGEVCPRSVLSARLKRERGEAPTKEADQNVPDPAQG